MKPFNKSFLTVTPDGVKLKNIGFRINEELYKKLTTEAKLEHRSVNAQIILIIEQYFDPNVG